jgi:hypothetical protein
MANITDLILISTDTQEPNYSEDEELLRENFLQRKAPHIANLVNTRGSIKSATIPSGTVLGLMNASINFVTGTTTINAISIASLNPPVTVGFQTTLIFQGSLTVTHNAAVTPGANAILLGNSSNLSAALNTVLTLMFDGTYWQEISKKVA